MNQLIANDIAYYERRIKILKALDRHADVALKLKAEFKQYVYFYVGPDDDFITVVAKEGRRTVDMLKWLTSKGYIQEEEENGCYDCGKIRLWVR